jgi:hypothetical protein
MKNPGVVQVAAFHSFLFTVNAILSSADASTTRRTIVTRFAPGFVPARPSNVPHNHNRQRRMRHLDTSHRKVIAPKYLRPSSNLFIRPQENLIAGLCEISFAFSLGVLWSEYSIILTGCGPINFSDSLERICYQGVIASAGVALFLRIVTNGKSLEMVAQNTFGPLQDSTLIQLRFLEVANTLAVLGAFLALGFQEYRGTAMDGLSGIDVDMCDAIRSLG